MATNGRDQHRLHERLLEIEIRSEGFVPSHEIRDMQRDIIQLKKVLTWIMGVAAAVAAAWAKSRLGF